MKISFLWLMVALIWGTSFAFIKVAVETLSPFFLVSIRMSIAAIILYAYFKWRGHVLSRSVKVWTTYFVVGTLSNVIPFTLLGYGEQYVDSGLAAIFMGLTPVLVVVFSPFIFPEERYRFSSVLGIVLGFSGVIILVGFDALQGLGDRIYAQVAVFLAACCYSSAVMYTKKHITTTPLETATGSTIIGAVIIFFVSAIVTQFDTLAVPSSKSIFSAIYLGVFSTAGASLIYFYIINYMSASKLSMTNFVVPLVGALVGVFFLDEELSTRAWVALGCIMTAVYLVNIRKSKSS